MISQSKAIHGLTKKDLAEYDKEIRKKAKKFKIKPEDFHNLYDLFWITDGFKDVTDTLKINNMDKWFYNFTARVERVLFSEDFALELKKEKYEKERLINYFITFNTHTKPTRLTSRHLETKPAANLEEVH